jgi:hypothetical protein
MFNYTGKCLIGGILACLLPDDLFNPDGYTNQWKAYLMTQEGYEQDDDIIIDDLPPDYNILKQVENY